jgi:hypothetical protein
MFPSTVSSRSHRFASAVVLLPPSKIIEARAAPTPSSSWDAVVRAAVLRSRCARRTDQSPGLDHRNPLILRVRHLVALLRTGGEPVPEGCS